jgi:hypothetical protein
VVDGVETMASVLHPSLFGEPPRDRAMRIQQALPQRASTDPIEPLI